MSMKQEPVWTWPGSFSSDTAQARGMFFLGWKILRMMAAIVVE